MAQQNNKQEYSQHDIIPDIAMHRRGNILHKCRCKLKPIPSSIVCLCIEYGLSCICQFIVDTINLESHISHVPNNCIITGASSRYSIMFFMQYVVFAGMDSKIFVDLVQKRKFEEIYEEFVGLISTYKLNIDEMWNTFISGGNVFESITNEIVVSFRRFVENNFHSVSYDLEDYGLWCCGNTMTCANGTICEHNIYDEKYENIEAADKSIMSSLVHARESVCFSDMITYIEPYTKNIPKSRVCVKKCYECNTKLAWVKNLIPDLKDMVIEIFSLWDKFKKSSTNVDDTYSTLIKLNGIFMVPGGRFREFYYWDSYWILLGLLTSGEYMLSFEVVQRFTEIIHKFGFIPNGMRQYYTDRSQPPMFVRMLSTLYKETDDDVVINFILNQGLEAAIVEYDYFMIFKRIHISDDILLNKYEVYSDMPRPESYKEDIATYKNASEEERKLLYSNLRTGAESGWDYSTRWFSDGENLGTIDIINIIPVDLNAYMFSNERNLIYLLKERLNHSNPPPNIQSIIDKLEFNNTKREYSMNKVLWNKDKSIWMDYNVKTNTFSDTRFYFSNLTPLFSDVSVPDNLKPIDLLKIYHNDIFSNIGGVPASGYHATKISTQQWDYPNTWAPLVHMLVDYLYRLGEYELALHSARCFIRSVRAIFLQTGSFQEKYNAVEIGMTGGGGEYICQEGFGWTNGVVVWMVKIFGNDLDDDDHVSSYKNVCKILGAEN